MQVIVDLETVNKTVCGRDAAVELIRIYYQRVWITVSRLMIPL
jgi:hypothetical protein